MKELPAIILKKEKRHSLKQSRPCGQNRTNDSEKFCRQMLKEIGVATTPGTDFDLERGRSYIRFSFSGPPKDIEEAVQRIKNWLPNRAKTQFF